MKENRKLLREVLKDICHDMTDEEVLNLLADSKISENLAGEKEKYTIGQRAADAIAKFAGSWAFIFAFTGVLILWMLVNTLLAPEPAGGKGPPPRGERLPSQPQNGDHDRGSLRQGKRHSRQTYLFGKTAGRGGR